jgi:hypothetical protein
MELQIKNDITYQELYKKGKIYKTYRDTHTIIDVRFSKTGRISAKIKSEKGDSFWSASVNPAKKVGLVHISSKLVATCLKIYK